MVDKAKQRKRRRTHFACDERDWPKALRDFYQINKMERNKNNANAINAISIGTFFASSSSSSSSPRISAESVNSPRALKMADALN